jgi:hypothetical protein
METRASVRNNGWMVGTSGQPTLSVVSAKLPRGDDAGFVGEDDRLYAIA